MAFTILVIITMFNQHLGGEHHCANVLPICQSLMHTSIRPWCLVSGVMTFSALTDEVMYTMHIFLLVTMTLHHIYKRMSQTWRRVFSDNIFP